MDRETIPEPSRGLTYDQVKEFYPQALEQFENWPGEGECLASFMQQGTTVVYTTPDGMLWSACYWQGSLSEPSFHAAWVPEHNSWVDKVDLKNV